MTLQEWMGTQGLALQASRARPKSNADYYSPVFPTITKRDRKQKNGSDVGKVYSGGPGSGRHPEYGKFTGGQRDRGPRPAWSWGGPNGSGVRKVHKGPISGVDVHEYDKNGRVGVAHFDKHSNADDYMRTRYGIK